jgi:hypothetical protein
MELTDHVSLVKALDSTKLKGGRTEMKYADIREGDGIHLRTRYRNNGPASQWGVGRDNTGTARKKIAGPKTEHQMEMYVGPTGRVRMRRRVEEVDTTTS